MNNLWREVTHRAKKENIAKATAEFREKLMNEPVGSLIECPECHYIQKNNRPSGKIFVEGKAIIFKCFFCGIWRRLK